MLQKKYGSWRIGKRWRINRKNSKNDAPEAIDGNNEPSTCRTSFLSDKSSGGHTDYTASLSGSVHSEHNSSYNQLMSSSSTITTTATMDEVQQWEQQMKQKQKKKKKNPSFGTAEGDRDEKIDKKKKKKKKEKDRTDAGAEPMPQITEEHDILFDLTNNDDLESDTEEYVDLNDLDETECDIEDETETECDDDIDSGNVGNDHQCVEGGKYQVAPANPLPQRRELSREICTIVLGTGGKPNDKNRRRALSSLLKVSGWVERRDQSFLRNFLIYGGIAKILDFLEDLVAETEEGLESRSESNGGDGEDDKRRRQQRHGEEELMQHRIAIESIRCVARVLSGLCRTEKKEKRASATQERINMSRIGQPSSPTSFEENLTEATATVIVNHGGIETLLRASSVCCRSYKNNQAHRKEETPAPATFDAEAISLVEATEEVWTAIANTCTSSNDETATKIVDGISLSVWGAGLAAMETFCAGIGFGGFDTDVDSGHTSAAVAAASAPPVVAVLLLNTSVFRAFETILVRRRGDPLVTRNLFAEQGVLSRLVKLVPGPKKTPPAMDIMLNINGSARSNASLQNSLRNSTNSGSSMHSTISHIHGKAESNYEEEAFLMEEALCFFYECHTQELLFRKNTRRKTRRSNASDEKWFPCEGMIPLCVAGLQKFGMDSTTIRRKAFRILNGAVDSCIDDKINNAGGKKDDRQQIILAELIEGAIEALATCLISDRINETEKDKFRMLMRKIVGMESDGSSKESS